MLLVSNVQASMVEDEKLLSERAFAGSELPVNGHLKALATHLSEPNNQRFAFIDNPASGHFAFEYPAICALDFSWGGRATTIDSGSFSESLSERHYSSHDPACFRLNAASLGISTAPKREHYAVSYVLDDSITEHNLIAPYVDNTGWQLSDSDKMQFTFIRDTFIDLPESASIALLGLGIVALGMFRRKEASKLNQAE